MIRAINAILISTKSAEPLIQFYQKLGVPLKLENHGGGVHAEADFGDVHFAIWERPSASDPVKASNLSFSFHVPHLEEFYEKKVREGMVFDHPPMALPFGGVVTGLKDPDGNRITLMRWDSDRK